MDRIAIKQVFLFLFILRETKAREEQILNFPKNFKFGVCTSAFQIEGAWNISDKSESVWDYFVHNKVENIVDDSNADISCDSYHFYKRDVEMLKELGVDYYRFSISWSRLLPTGLAYKISQDGLNYYNNLINELVKNNIEPMVTLFHWDTPQVLQTLGGWANAKIIDYFEDYARVVFENFGDRVKEWVTFNEPHIMCTYGYGKMYESVSLAPGLGLNGIGEYLCSHNVIKAHARAYHLYDDVFRSKQKGKVSIGNYLFWAEPESKSERSLLNAEKTMQFIVGWYSHPIYSKEGDYPAIMREEVDKMSKLQNFTDSRLPRFTEEEIKYIRGTFDYVGYNFYTSAIPLDTDGRWNYLVPSIENDIGFSFRQKPEWENFSHNWYKLYPNGFRKALNWAVKQYGNHEIRILETGCSSIAGLEDDFRILYFRKYLTAILDAIEDGCNVTSFAIWSLLDNFEWINGYENKFGLYQVDFNSPNKTRTPRNSAFAYKKIISTRQIISLHSDYE